MTASISNHTWALPSKLPQRFDSCSTSTRPQPPSTSSSASLGAGTNVGPVSITSTRTLLPVASISTWTEPCPQCFTELLTSSEMRSLTVYSSSGSSPWWMASNARRAHPGASTPTGRSSVTLCPMCLSMVEPPITQARYDPYPGWWSEPTPEFGCG